MKNGFTLTELLAVIIVLSVVAMITVPIFSNQVNVSKQESFKIGVEHFMTALKNNQAEEDFVSLNITFPLSNDSTFTIDGDTSDWTGYGKITESGQIQVMIHNGTYCAYKNYSTELEVKETSYSKCQKLVSD